MAATVRVKSRGGVGGDLAVNGLEAFLEVMHKLPGRMRERVLTKSVNAGGNPILKAGRQMAPRGTYSRHEVKGGLSVHSRQNNAPRLANTFIKKVKGYGFRAVAIMGSKSRSAPHGHLVHQGTGQYVIGTPPKGSRKPRKGNRDYAIPAGKILRIPVGPNMQLRGGGAAPGGTTRAGNYIFIRGPHIIRNKGSRPNPWWDFAATKEQNNAMRALKDKLGTEIVRELKK